MIGRCCCEDIDVDTAEILVVGGSVGGGAIIPSFDAAILIVDSRPPFLLLSLHFFFARKYGLPGRRLTRLSARPDTA